VLAVAALAAAAVLVATAPHGPRVTTDSVLYLSTADSLREHHNLAWYQGTPLTHFPPGYPTALAVAGELAGSGVLGGRILNALCLALIVVLGWMLLRRHVESPALRLAGVVGLAVAPTLFFVASAAWSEPLFIVLVLATVLALEMAIERPASWQWPIAAALLASGAFFVRYAGLWLIATTAVVLLLGGRRLSSPGERVRRLVVFAIVVSIVPAWVIARNLRLANGHPFSQRGEPNTSLDTAVADTTDGIVRWLLPEDAAAVALVTLLAALIVAIGVWLVHRRDIPRSRAAVPPRALLWPLALLVSSYIAFLLASAETAYLDPIGFRLLSPAFPLAVILALGAVDRLASAQARRGPFILAGAVVAVAWLVAQVHATESEFQRMRDDGAGYTEQRWRDSRLLELVRRRAIDPTFVNHADALYFLTGLRGSCWPTATQSVCTGSGPDLELLDSSQPIYLAWLAGPGDKRPYVSSALARKVQLNVVATVADGQLYRVRADSPESPGGRRNRNNSLHAE
jgi:hypothetical protein